MNYNQKEPIILRTIRIIVRDNSYPDSKSAVNSQQSPATWLQQTARPVAVPHHKGTGSLSRMLFGVLGFRVDGLGCRNF